MSTQDLMMLISAGVGIILSVGFKIIPWLDRWFYNTVADDWRGLVMVGFNALSALAIFGLTCVGLFATVACTQEGAVSLIKAFLVMLGTNQMTNLATGSSNTKKKIAALKARAVKESTLKQAEKNENSLS